MSVVWALTGFVVGVIFGYWWWAWVYAWKIIGRYQSHNRSAGTQMRQ